MRRWAAVLLGVGVAAVCARLGVWQVHRLAERRAWNARVEARLDAPALTLTSGVTTVPADSLTYRRARVRGVFAFADQTVEVLRSQQGMPGLYVMTPLRFADGTGILVNRGWTFAPDGATANREALAEPESTTVEGVLLPAVGRLAVRPEWMAVGYPLFPLVLRRTAHPADAPAGLAVAELPPRDNGPHLSYAVQWFAFGLIALVGGSILARRSGRDQGRQPR